MTLQELTNKYYFHDSLVPRLEWDSANRSFLMEIGFCNRAQDYYTDKMAENITITLTFNNVRRVEGHTVKVVSNCISTCEVKNDSIIFLLLRDYIGGDGGVDEVQIWADNVDADPVLP